MDHSKDIPKIKWYYKTRDKSCPFITIQILDMPGFWMVTVFLQEGNIRRIGLIMLCSFFAISWNMHTKNSTSSIYWQCWHCHCCITFAMTNNTPNKSDKDSDHSKSSTIWMVFFGHKLCPVFECIWKTRQICLVFVWSTIQKRDKIVRYSNGCPVTT